MTFTFAQVQDTLRKAAPNSWFKVAVREAQVLAAERAAHVAGHVSLAAVDVALRVAENPAPHDVGHLVEGGASLSGDLCVGVRVDPSKPHIEVEVGPPRRIAEAFERGVVVHGLGPYQGDE